MRPFAWGWVFFASCLTLPVAATPTLEQEIRASFAPPPTAWAQPYAGGTTRALFFGGEGDA